MRQLLFEENLSAKILVNLMSCIVYLQPEMASYENGLPFEDLVDDSEISIERLQQNKRKLKSEMKKEIVVPSATIPGVWTTEFLRNLDMASLEIKQMVDQARKSAQQLFSCKSAKEDFNEGEFCDVDDCSSSLIAEFVTNEMKLDLKAQVRMCELLTQLIGRSALLQQ